MYNGIPFLYLRNKTAILDILSVIIETLNFYLINGKRAPNN